MAFERTEITELMTATVQVNAWASAFDGYGEPTYSTSASTYDCRIEERPTIVKNEAGQDIVSRLWLIVASTVAFKGTDQFTVVTADGSTQVPPVQHIERVYDDEGLHHQVVYLGGGF